MAELDNKLVVRISNEITKNSFDEMSKLQSDILVCILGKYVSKKTLEAQKGVITTSVQELCQILNLERGGTTYKTIAIACNNLFDDAKVIWFDKEKREINKLHYFKQFRANIDTLEVTFSFEPDVLPYIEHLTKNFTQYLADGYFNLKTKSGKSLFTLCQAYRGLHTFTMSIDDLKEKLNATKHQSTQMKHFMYQVVKVAVDDINTNNSTNMYVEYKPIKKGRKVSAIRFDISTPRSR